MAQQGYYSQMPPGQPQPPPPGGYAAAPYGQQQPYGQQASPYGGGGGGYYGAPLLQQSYGHGAPVQQGNPNAGYHSAPRTHPSAQSGFFYHPPQSRSEMKDWKGSNEWQTSMLKAPCAEPVMCLMGCVCPWCCVYKQRERLLMEKWSNYQCCAGIWGPSLTAKCNKCTEGKEQLCMCLEATCCLGCAVHGNRWMVMQHYGLKNDCCDVFIMYLACICSILACLLNDESLENVADLIFYISVGCMIAQHHNQMEKCGYPNQMPPAPVAPRM